MKREWKKHEKEYYGVKDKPVELNVPMQQFITIRGKGNPNDVAFSQKVGALYALAYAIKMAYKKASTQKDISDFAVYPLEGIWSQLEGDTLNKDKLEYTIMIRQPDFITSSMVQEAMAQVKSKKPSVLYDDIHFEEITDGACVQVLHVGAFDDEPVSFAKLNAYLAENGMKRVRYDHREIYLNNANRTSADKLKTILRYFVTNQ